MATALSNPNTISFLGSLSVGAMYARGLITIFAIQAIAFAFYKIGRMRRELHLLDEGAKVRQARLTAGNGEPQNQKRDVWTS